MPNIQNKRMTKDQLRFVDDVAALLTPWGMPATAARMYGYLMLKPAPVSLDEMVADLRISKSSASVAARALEQYKLVRRHRVSGSKRVLYTASDNFAGRLMEQSALLRTLGSLLDERRPAVAGGEVGRRLQALAEFYSSMAEAMDASIRTLNARFSRR